MLVSSTQAESGRQPLERHGVTPRPNAPPPTYRKPFRLAVPALLALIVALAAGPTAAHAQTTLVSNTGQGNSGARAVDGIDFAQAFGTGSNTAGYDLASIVLSLGEAPFGTGTLTVTVREDASGDPSGTALHTLTNPDPFVTDDLNTFPAPAGATLDANTTYWVVASYSSSGGPNWWRVLLSNGIDSGGATGWTIDSPYKADTRTSPVEWVVQSASRGLKLQVKGTVKGGPTLSTDATLSALALSGVTLAPTFVSSTETYTATVVNSVMQTTVTATPTHSGATVAFKDGDDNALTNPVTLAVGATVIKAVVTAEDTTTTKTYMVTVTRATTTDTAVTIEAEYESIGGGLEDLKFTLTRAGDTTDALDVTVTITQAQTWLGNLEYTVTFPADNDTATLPIGRSNFSFTPSTAGNLTATVSGDGIDGGSDTVQIISTSEAPITISYDMPDYTFAEDATDEAVYMVATLNAAYPRPPSFTFDAASFSSRGDTATSPEDYGAISDHRRFSADDFERDDDTDPFVARALIQDFIVPDDIYEGAERFVLWIEAAPGVSADLVQFAYPNGTTCAPINCSPTPEYEVTITDVGDLPVLSLSVDPPSIAEEDDDGTTSVAENVSTVTVEITNGKTFAVDQTATLTFSGTATQGTHYSVSPGDADSGTGGHQVVLLKETASVEVTVTAVGNDTADGPRTVTVKGTLGAKDIGSSRDITILDDENPLSTDATLSALALSGVTLAPTFASATENYTATVGNSVMQTTVTATPTHSGATVTFKDGDDNALTNPVTLAVGANVIKAVVTAEDTTTMKTYMVTVTREDATTTMCLAPDLTGRTGIWTGTVTVAPNVFNGDLVSYGFGYSWGALNPQLVRFETNNSYTVDLATCESQDSFGSAGTARWRRWTVRGSSCMSAPTPRSPSPTRCSPARHIPTPGLTPASTGPRSRRACSI